MFNQSDIIINQILSLTLEKAEKVRPSKRGELEITDLNILYLNKDLLDVQVIS